jgi:hypothetical protein
LRNGTIPSTNAPPQLSTTLPQGNRQPSVQGPPSYFPTSQTSLPNQRPQASNQPLNLNDIRQVSMSSHPSPSYPPSHPVNTRGDSARFSVKSEPYRQTEESQTSSRRLSREKLHIPLPPLPESFPELSTLSAAQLKRFLSDDAAVNVVTSSLPPLIFLRLTLAN